MINTNPKYPVEVIRVLPVGPVTHAVKRCPRCQCNIGINDGMKHGVESIICKGSLGAGLCNGHYYLRGDLLEFVGTVK